MSNFTQNPCPWQSPKQTPRCYKPNTGCKTDKEVRHV